MLTDVKDDPAGLDVCLFCFNGGCNTERQHSKVHYEKTKHPLVVNIQRTRKKIKVGTCIPPDVSDAFAFSIQSTLFQLGQG